MDFTGKLNLENGLQLDGVDGTTGQTPVIDGSGDLSWGSAPLVRSMVMANPDNTFDFNQAGVNAIPFNASLIQEAGWSHTAATNTFTYTGTPSRVEVKAHIVLIDPSPGTDRYEPQLWVRASATGTLLRTYASGYIRSQDGIDGCTVSLVWVDVVPGTNPTYTFEAVMGDTNVRTQTIRSSVLQASQIILEAIG